MRIGGSLMIVMVTSFPGRRTGAGHKTRLCPVAMPGHRHLGHFVMVALIAPLQAKHLSPHQQQHRQRG